MKRRLRVLVVQDQVMYQYGDGYQSVDALVNWYRLLAQKVDLTVATRVFDLQNISESTRDSDDIAIKSIAADAGLIGRLHRVDPSIKIESLPEFASIRQLSASPRGLFLLFRRLRKLVRDRDVVFTNLASPSAVLAWLSIPGDTAVVAMLRGNLTRDVKYRYSGLTRTLASLGVSGLAGFAGVMARIRHMGVLGAGMETVRIAEKLGMDARNWYVSNITRQDIDKSKAFVRNWRNHRPMNLITVTRFEPEKGVDVLIDAASILHRQKMRFNLKIVGRGGMKSVFEARIERLGLQDMVKLVDFLPRQQLFEAYQQADILVNPSYTEGLPLIFFEAGLWALPIVATGVGGIPDDYPHKKRAFLVPRANPDALAEGIRIVMSDERLRSEIGNNARKFTWQHPMETDIDKQLGFLEEWVRKARQ